MSAHNIQNEADQTASLEVIIEQRMKEMLAGIHSMIQQEMEKAMRSAWAEMDEMTHKVMYRFEAQVQSQLKDLKEQLEHVSHHANQLDVDMTHQSKCVEKLEGTLDEYTQERRHSSELLDEMRNRVLSLKGDFDVQMSAKHNDIDVRLSERLVELEKQKLGTREMKLIADFTSILQLWYEALPTAQLPNALKLNTREGKYLYDFHRFFVKEWSGDSGYEAKAKSNTLVGQEHDQLTMLATQHPREKLVSDNSPVEALLIELVTVCWEERRRVLAQHLPI